MEHHCLQIDIQEDTNEGMPMQTDLGKARWQMGRVVEYRGSTWRLERTENLGMLVTAIRTPEIVSRRCLWVTPASDPS